MSALKGPRSSGAGALAVAAGILLSRLAGLVRERVFAHFLGNSDAAGAFKAALRIPNLLQNLFGEGVLSASFIPVYARLLASGELEQARRLAGVIVSLLTLAVGLLVALGTLAAPLLTDLIAPGFSAEVRQLTISLVQVVFPGVGLLVLSAWCLGVLNSHRRFFLSYVAPVLWNIVQIAALVVGGALVGGGTLAEGHLVRLLAWATVLGSACQLAVQLPATLHLLGGLTPSVSLRAPGVRRVLASFAPVVVGRGVVQLSAYIDQVLASYLGPGMVAAMAYAQQLYLLPVALFGMAISAAELPAMSVAVGSDEQVHALLRARAESALARMAFFVVPSAAALVVLGDVVVAALYQTGRFGARDTVVVWIVLAGYAVGLLAATRGRLYASALYALHDPRAPLRYALLRVALAALGGWILALPVRRALGWPPELGAAGLTLSAGLAAWLEYLLLAGAVQRRIGQLGPTATATGRAWAAALVACGAALLLHRLLPIHQPVVAGLIVLGAYGAVYLGAARALGLDEARGLIDRLRALLRRRS